MTHKKRTLYNETSGSEITPTIMSADYSRNSVAT